jgi:hypothetical protein
VSKQTLKKERLLIWRTLARAAWRLADNAVADGLGNIPNLVLRTGLDFVFFV